MKIIKTFENFCLNESQYFEFSTGSGNWQKKNYTIQIFANTKEEAEEAWEKLQKRNYYPTGRRWYVSTDSCNPPSYKE